MLIRNIADIHAMEATPLSDRALPRSTFEAITNAAECTPNAKALSFFLTAETYDRPVTWSYVELLADITRAANTFRNLGVDADHPVAFVLPNLPEAHFTIWGGEAAGVVFAINPLFEPVQIAELLRVAGVRVLVTLARTPGIELWDRLVPHLVRLPELRTVALVSLSNYLEKDIKPAEAANSPEFAFEIIDFRTAMMAQPADHLVVPREISADTVSSYFCTGGTTGSPKIAVRTHGNEVFDAWAAGQVLGGGECQRTHFCGLPLFHVNAQLVTGLSPWMKGDHVVLATPEGYRSKSLIARFWEIVSHYRVSTFSGVPTIYSTLLEVPIGESDISGLEFAMCGAAPMPAKLIESFESVTGIKIVEGYGLTEGTCVSSVNPPTGERRPGSIGLRLPYQEMRAVILDSTGHFQRMANIDEIGTLAIKGPNVFKGYFDARHNRDLWIEIDSAYWLNTGDLSRQDSDGYFWLAGRRKELIIRGGHNIDPKLIEDALHLHPAVAIAAAVGCPDAHAGEVPVGYVQLKPGAQATEQELLDFVAKKIPERAAVPRHVKIKPTMPLTGVGKIFKPALYWLEVEAVVREEARKVETEITDIRVDREAQGSEVIRVRTGPGAALLQKALDRYVFKSDVSE